MPEHLFGREVDLADLQRVVAPVELTVRRDQVLVGEACLTLPPLG
ncbi:MAG: hypothetical protein ACT4NP_08905 [Pseudonocardiales bacterium]